LLAGLVVAAVLNLLATRLRHRVTVQRAAERLVVTPQRAALWLDVAILLICLAWLLYAVLARSTLGLLFSGLAAAMVGARVLAAHRAPDFTFDRAQDQFRRWAQVVCPLSRVEALEIQPGVGISALQLRYRDAAGAPRHQRLHAAQAPQVAAQERAIVAFLRTPPRSRFPAPLHPTPYGTAPLLRTLLLPGH
jgi:hypothetical protein